MWRHRSRIAAILAAIGVLATLLTVPASPAEAARWTVYEENQNPGSSGWNIRNRGTDVGMEIKGYASAASVNVGQRIDFHVSVSDPQDFEIEIYRMGWYQGTGGRLMTTIGPLPGTTKADPTVDPATGLVSTDWAPDTTFRIPRSWESGVYLGRLVRADGKDNHIVFVVRDDNRRADFLVQIPITTYQAYNNFPNDGTTGKSLYDFNSFGPAPTDGTGAPRALEVSFDRPFSNDGNGQFFLYDYALVRFLEREGYDVAYTTNVDVHNDPIANHYAGFISSGHDEYWTAANYDHVEEARDREISLAFIGANSAYWRIELLPSTLDGTADRVMRSRQDPNVDQWRAAGRPEQSLIGVQYISPISYNYQPLVVTNSSHWLWANTGVSDGDTVDQLVGYEVDTFWSSYPAPVTNDQTLLAASPFQGNIQNTSIYTAPSGAIVFGAGTLNWSRGLGHPWYASVEDARIQQATRNLLDTMSRDNTNTICDGQPITVRVGLGESPTGGDDVILGTNGPDVIDGGGGNDRICGLNGDDTLSGGDGDDRVRGQGGADTLNGGDGNDFLHGGGGRDTCDGGPGSNRLRSC